MKIIQQTNHFGVKLLQATNGQQLTTFYQPIKELKTGKITGYEALTRGIEGLGAEQLFKAAESLKISFETDTFCFKNIICSTPRDMKIFINILPHTLFLLVAAGIMEEMYRPGLVLEIIEIKRLGRMREEMLTAIRKARETGYEIAIDDLSSGYDRLRLLAEIEPDYVKMDLPLVRNCNSNKKNQTILHHITQLCKDLKVDVIAEGIETREEAEVIKGLGIKFGQGYYLGRPDTLDCSSIPVLVNQ